MSLKSILKELFKSDYKITSIKRYDSGLIKAQTSSLRWGDDFSLLCIKEEQIPYAKKCLAFLDAMQEDMEARLRKYLFRYYGWFEQFLDDNDKARIGTITEESILSHISIHSVIVDDNCREDIVEFHVEGRCDWEPEHGLEITIPMERFFMLAHSMITRQTQVDYHIYWSIMGIMIRMQIPA